MAPPELSSGRQRVTSPGGRRGDAARSRDGLLGPICVVDRSHSVVKLAG